MEVTRVIFEEPDNVFCNSIALCSVILDDCLKLTNIRLCKNTKGYYLILPSKQDIYKKISEINPVVDIKYPKVKENVTLKKNQPCEEFFHPVDYSMYARMLDVIVTGYMSGKKSYRP